MSHLPKPGWRRLLLEASLAVALGLALLLTTAWQQLSLMDEMTDDWSSLMEGMHLKLSGTPLGDAVYLFIAGQLLLHAGFGLTCWLLSLCTRMAYPRFAHRRWTLLLLWTGLVIAWVLVGNATRFPYSSTGIPSPIFGHEILQGLRFFDIFTLLLLSLILVVLIRAARAVPRIRTQLPRLALLSVLSLAAWGAWQVRHLTRLPEEARTSAKPNLILIGIDSLRCDVVGGGRSIGYTPNIDAFLRDGGHLFTDAITPLGRTFPSWTSILTGQYPRTTGVRENLQPIASLKKFDTIAHLARSAGYHTIFATDEVRFSNIDQSYGFDQVLTPTIGAADFLLAKANDLPLPNMIANTWLGLKLFPATYANRAAAWTYLPETFVDRLDTEVNPDGQTLFAVHLTLPHTPYYWAEQMNDLFGESKQRAYQYASAVLAADQQFGDIMVMLERKGMLRNAIVVLLSDHGEALGLPASDTLLRGNVARQLLEGDRISVWGHGTSVLSPHQFAAVLAVRGFGDTSLGEVAREHGEPVSLVDVAPTLAEFAGLKLDPARFDGWSLKPLLDTQPDSVARFQSRPRFTETGLRTKRIAEGDFDEGRVMNEAAGFFTMNPANGRFELRSESKELIENKDRAVLSSNWLLAATSQASPDTHKYVLVSRRGGLPRRLVSPPDAKTEPEIHALWQALADHYGDELRPPAPREDEPPTNVAATR